MLLERIDQRRHASRGTISVAELAIAAQPERVDGTSFHLHKAVAKAHGDADGFVAGEGAFDERRHAPILAVAATGVVFMLSLACVTTALVPFTARPQPRRAVGNANRNPTVRMSTLYDMPVSNHGARVRLLLYKKGLESEVAIAKPVDLGGLVSDEYKALNPQCKMPLLVDEDEGVTVYEADAICRAATPPVAFIRARLRKPAVRLMSCWACGVAPQFPEASARCHEAYAADTLRRSSTITLTAPGGAPASSHDTFADGGSQLLGTGPWSWTGVAPVAFLAGGRLHTPWGPGTWGAHGDGDRTVFANFVGEEHIVRFDECFGFASTRKRDGDQASGRLLLDPPAKVCPPLSKR